jgi:hypothetical protein
MAEVFSITAEFSIRDLAMAAQARHARDLRGWIDRVGRRPA